MELWCQTPITGSYDLKDYSPPTTMAPGGLPRFIYKSDSILPYTTDEYEIFYYPYRELYGRIVILQNGTRIDTFICIDKHNGICVGKYTTEYEPDDPDYICVIDMYIRNTTCKQPHRMDGPSSICVIWMDWLGRVKP